MRRKRQQKPIPRAPTPTPRSGRLPQLHLVSGTSGSVAATTVRDRSTAPLVRGEVSAAFALPRFCPRLRPHDLPLARPLGAARAEMLPRRRLRPVAAPPTLGVGLVRRPPSKIFTPPIGLRDE
jgi:hypothetical protein